MSALLDALAWPFGFLVDGALTLGVGAAVAICLCVAVVRCVLFPLSLHQARSHWVLAGIQPQVAELQERYRHDPDGVREELVALYSAHRVSPFGFALVLIPQALVLVGLYWALREHFQDLSGIGALGDLNEPAHSHAVGIGLVVAYSVGFCASMWISMKRTSAEVSKLILAFMAAVPVGALIAMPVMNIGMALYLCATALVGIVQAVVLWRLYPRRTPPDSLPSSE